MKAFTRACLVALPFLALPSLAQAWGMPPCKIDAGINAHLNGYCGNICLCPQAGPWYSYFPYDAYFQTPAPVGGWPFWPTNAAPAIPPGVQNGSDDKSNNSNGPQSMFYQRPGVQPAGYGAPAPSYWYGR
jgi:hypothetical protein